LIVKKKELESYKNNLEFDNAQLTMEKIHHIEYAIQKLKLAKVNKEAAITVEGSDKKHAEKNDKFETRIRKRNCTRNTSIQRKILDIIRKTRDSVEGIWTGGWRRTRKINEVRITTVAQTEKRIWSSHEEKWLYICKESVEGDRTHHERRPEHFKQSQEWAEKMLSEQIQI